MNNIILTGFMGTGKSAVGAYVAERLRRPFVDMDKQIEQKYGRKVSEIFADAGEATFRRFERELTQELATKKGLVIATGGGTLLDSSNRDAFQQSGVVICLRASVDQILQRVGDKNTRPLLAGASPRQRVEELLAQRASIYDALPLQVDTTEFSIEAVGERVIALASGLTAADTFEMRVHAPDLDYSVIIGDGMLAEMGRLMKRLPLAKRVAVVTNDTLAPLYGQDLTAQLCEAGFEPVLCTIPDGEPFKTPDTVRELYTRFAQAHLERRSAVVAVGGGVVGDTAGFAAATYLRGLPLIQIPTSLLAMVDASVGGKVGVDLPGTGKNLVGAFKQPSLVMADTALLASLPAEELRAGLAEVVKHGVIGAPALFEELETHGARNFPRLVSDAVRVKIRVVEADPFEQNIRAHLNLGHTFAHALELVSNFSMRHGEAVAIGMVAACHLSEARGIARNNITQRVTQLLENLGLPTRIPPTLIASPEQLYQAMGSDKKRRDGKLRFVLAEEIGRVRLDEETPEAIVLDAWRAIGVATN